jgi:hypothetical protein
MFYHSNHAFTGSDNQSIEKTKLKSRLPIQITPRGSVLTPLIGSNSIALIDKLNGYQFKSRLYCLYRLR